MLEVFGDKVIPEFDKDPVHSTTRYRQQAERRYPELSHPIPEDLEVELIPNTALLPLAR
jgi:hypothetical protein